MYCDALLCLNGVVIVLSPIVDKTDLFRAIV